MRGMIQPQVLDALLEAGASAEMIVAAVKAATCAEEAKRGERRAKDAARQRRVRGTRTVAAESCAARVTPRDGTDAPPNDINSNPPSPRSSDEDLTPLAEKLVTEWNGSAAAAGAIPCRGLNVRRQTALRARLREHGEAALFEAVRNLAASEFHCGRNPRGWRATLGWLLAKPESLQGMIELTPAAETKRSRMTPEEQLASTERSPASLERMGRTDEAAELRRTADKLRQQIERGGV